MIIYLYNYIIYILYTYIHKGKGRPSLLLLLFSGRRAQPKKGEGKCLPGLTLTHCTHPGGHDCDLYSLSISLYFW